MRPVYRTSLLAAFGLVASLALVSRAQDAPKQIKIADNVYLQIDGKHKRVLVDARVCLRQGMLEQLLTRKRTKEHEAILAVDADAREIHKALLLAGAEQGSPVKFRPKFAAPTGTPIKITLEYQDKAGKTVRVPAQQWIQNIKTKKDLDSDWVFAGSVLIADPFDRKKPPFYGANDGDVICISNFDTAMLDVPFNSSKENDELAFVAHTDRIPPLDTPVRIILEPVPVKKK